MPQFITRPARGLAATQFISLLQQQRRQAEEERAEERERQKRDAIIGAGLALGAVGGFLLAPAAAAAASAATFTAGGTVGAATAAASAATLTGTLAGAAFGGQIAGGFTGGDVGGGVANAVGLASKAVQKFQKAQDDLLVFGGPISKQERRLLATLAIKLGTTIGNLERNRRLGGPLVGEQLQTLALEQADSKSVQSLLDNFNIPLEATQFIAAAETFEGGRSALLSELRGVEEEREIDFAARNEFAKGIAGDEAELFGAGQSKAMEAVFDEQDLAKRSVDLKEIAQRVADEDITPQQGTELRTSLQKPQQFLKPRQSPPTIEESFIPYKGFAFLRNEDGRTFRSIGKMSDVELPETAIDAFRDLMLDQKSFGKLVADMQVSMKFARQTGDDDIVTVEEAVDAIREMLVKQYKIMNEATAEAEAGAGVATQQGAAAEQQGKAQELFAQLKQMVDQQDPATWNPQQVAQANEMLQAVIADASAGDPNDPAIDAILQQALQFSDIINAKRDRNP